MPSVHDANPIASLAATLALLRNPESYPQPPARIDAIETHMSWVFLTDTTAYKLKKPVRYDYLDFTTSALRRRFCEEELRLNRRLAPSVYRGIVPITRGPAGGLRIDGAGRAVDWLVEMRRLPRQRMLDRALQERTVRAADIRRIALRLAAFYADAPPIVMDRARYGARFDDEIASCRDALGSLEPQAPRCRLDRIVTLLRDFVVKHRPLLDARRVVEAHGDLRPEHVFLGPPPEIIDCLEFQRDFRLLDPADELSYLAMECDRLGAPAVGKTLFETYARATNDRPPAALIAFYKSFRAFVRAKLAILHLKDAEVREPEKWPRQALSYLALADAESERLQGIGA